MEPWFDFLEHYLDYLVDDGAVNPDLLRQMYEVDLALVANSSPEAVQRLTDIFERAFQSAYVSLLFTCVRVGIISP